MWSFNRTGLFQSSGLQTILTIHPISNVFWAHIPNICGFFIIYGLYTCISEVLPTPQWIVLHAPHFGDHCTRGPPKKPQNLQTKIHKNRHHNRHLFPQALWLAGRRRLRKAGFPWQAPVSVSAASLLTQLISDIKSHFSGFSPSWPDLPAKFPYCSSQGSTHKTHCKSWEKASSSHNFMALNRG